MHSNNVFQYSKIRTRKRNAKKNILIKTVKNWNPALFGIRNPLCWNPESSTRNPESTAWNPESKNVLDSLTWGESNIVQTNNGEICDRKSRSDLQTIISRVIICRKRFHDNLDYKTRQDKTFIIVTLQFTSTIVWHAVSKKTLVEECQINSITNQILYYNK